ncbi:MAG: VPLPA-CTERM sorting domain-containing protein [Methylohalobius sp.]|nr:VPLPA-CTERM sorting domain-containing protein [Methylohalobius sp.]
MNSKKLKHAVNLALGVTLAAGALTAEAHTMYNTAIRQGTARVTGTDGWVYGSTDDGPSFNWNYPTPTPGWVGTGPGPGVNPTTPFGYYGKAHLNWAVEIHHAGESYEISKADALARYGDYISDVEIDTGAGAWQDAGVDNNGNPTAVGPTGWKHQTDIGLLKAHEDMFVSLAPSVVQGTGYDIQNFGITVFTGMDTNTGSYSHHGAWNCPGCNPSRPYNMDNPFGTQGVFYLTHDATVDANNPLTFLAQAGQVYSIYIGGAGVGRWNQNIADYKLNITTAPVPLPAAAWLMAPALLGLGALRRKPT